MKRETGKTINELSVKDKLYQNVLDSIPELILIINSEATITHINSHFKTFIGGSDFKGLDNASLNTKVKIENTVLDRVFDDLKLRTKFKKLNNESQSQDSKEAISSGNGLKSETDVKDLKDLEFKLRECKYLSAIVNSILQNIQFFKINQHFLITYDSKLASSVSKTPRSIEIKFSVTTSSISEGPSIVVVFKDTTERDVIVGLETDKKFKNDMLATISHELRTPLNGNINFLETAVASTEISESSKSEFLTPALNCSYLLKWVISDILDLALINANNVKPNVTIEDLLKTIDNCLKLVTAKIEQKGLKLITNLPEGPMLIGTDHSRLFQIMLNLLNNAIKFSERGTITVKVTSSLHSVTLSVSDEGIGMAPESKEKLQSYLKESTMHSKLNQDSSGTGFGLFISNFHAKLLGSLNDPNYGLHFSSTDKVGSAFWFSIEDLSKRSNAHQQALQMQRQHSNVIDIDIPYSLLHLPAFVNQDESSKMITQNITNDLPKNLNTDPDEEITEKSTTSKHLELHFTKQFKNPGSKFHQDSPQRPQCTCPKILIVDDDPYNILSLQKMLESLDYRCSTSYHGKEAVQRVNERKLKLCGRACRNYQLILMDCNMPIMNGFDACKKIREMVTQDGGLQPVIIGCTAYVTEHASVEGLACGMNKLINKPLSRAMLKEFIQSSLK
jgi:signal transduction histidine kinase/CheY-like chemotaxis protein